MNYGLQYWFVALTAGVLWLIVWFSMRFFSREARLARALRSEPSTPVERVEATQVVKLCGRARPGDRLLEAPLSGRACLVCVVRVWERRPGTGWYLIINSYESANFFVEDATGRAWVVVDRAEPLVKTDAGLRSGPRSPAGSRMRALLERHDQDKDWIHREKSLRYEEGVVTPGQPIAVLGQATLEPEPDAERGGESYRTRGKRVVLRAPENGPLLLSDDPSAIDASAGR